jgi:hypothetical protein
MQTEPLPDENTLTSRLLAEALLGMVQAWQALDVPGLGHPGTRATEADDYAREALCAAGLDPSREQKPTHRDIALGMVKARRAMQTVVDVWATLHPESGNLMLPEDATRMQHAINLCRANLPR